MKKQLLLGLLLAATSFQAQASYYKYVAGAALVGAGLYAFYTRTASTPTQFVSTPVVNELENAPVPAEDQELIPVPAIAAAPVENERHEELIGAPVIANPAPIIAQQAAENISAVSAIVRAEEAEEPAAQEPAADAAPSEATVADNAIPTLAHLTRNRATGPARRKPTHKTAAQRTAEKEQVEATQAANTTTAAAAQEPAPAKKKPPVVPRKKASDASAAAAAPTTALPTQIEAGPSAQDARAMFRARLNQTLAQQTAALPVADPEKAARIAALCNQTAQAAADAQQDDDDDSEDPIIARLKRIGAKRVA